MNKKLILSILIALSLNANAENMQDSSKEEKSFFSSIKSIINSKKQEDYLDDGEQIKDVNILKKLYVEKIKLLEYKEKELKMYNMTINNLKKEVELLQANNDINYIKINEKEVELFEKELNLKERERNLKQLEEKLSKIDNIQIIRESNVVNKENKLLELQLSLNINTSNEEKINKNAYVETETTDDLMIESSQSTKKKIKKLKTKIIKENKKNQDEIKKETVVIKDDINNKKELKSNTEVFKPDNNSIISNGSIFNLLKKKNMKNIDNF